MLKDDQPKQLSQPELWLETIGEIQTLSSDIAHPLLKDPMLPDLRGVLSPGLIRAKYSRYPLLLSKRQNGQPKQPLAACAMSGNAR